MLFEASIGAQKLSTTTHLAAFPQLEAVVARLANGDPTTIAYFGGSITWGACATDPTRSSWRALVDRELRRRYSRTPITVIDAAIGGQPSRLGVFRVNRDVISHAPHLCFVEFAVNDSTAGDAMESMEGIIRKLRASNECMAIVLVIIGAGSDYQCPAHDGQVRLAKHYGIPVVDVFAEVRDRLIAGCSIRDILADECHPNDDGHRLYAEIVVAQLDAACAARGLNRCGPVAPLTANRFEGGRMIELSKLSDCYCWQAGEPSRIGTWFDHTPSRWHDSSLRPTWPGARVGLELELSGAGLYFEMIPDGRQLVLKVDGAVHLEVETANTQGFSRVQHVFKWFDTPGRHLVTLEAPNGGPAAAAYFLVTG